MTENIEIKNIADFNKDDNISSLLKKLKIIGSQETSKQHLKRHFESLRNDLQVVIEYEYVDVMYRNEYYSFYSTKLKEYSRNCAKLSFFEPNSIKVDDNGVDYSDEAITRIKDGFLGFMVLRPITACIGRNVINVKAKKDHSINDIHFCKTKIGTSVLGIKVTVEGFPHASQDGEMIVCAETAIWSFCEYYGNKFPTHGTTLPSGILNALSDVSIERQMPSSGLPYYHVSTALKNLGLSPRIYKLYDKEEKSEELKEIFTTYVESGSPVVTCLYSSRSAHADICIGRTNTKVNLKSTKAGSTCSKRTLYWYNSSVDEFVFCDDNLPCYQIANFNSPTSYYAANKIKGWEDFKLFQFIVHLPCKVYNEATAALRLIKDIVNKNAGDGTVSRIILANSRSFRNHLSTSKLLSNEWKNLLIALPLPRYVWFCEMSNLEEFDKEMVSGLILMDATEKVNSFILYIERERVFENSEDKKTMQKPFMMERYKCER